ncbi:lipoate--protein ligase family protein [Geochorda subterranea]|uniref:Lipoate--protein ligase family protein n=1 Tax=Geochorda subterranea TaxID=3109564 RepID=A0ABZ1BPE0_9FIRM|nr:lipoate--protein ligase family protein [Limnochorda sp. LNt]WRP14672.1 lipoate--protein ligase family protein [Limnochorda sp. LNt]
MERWRLLVDPPGPAARNMAVDEAMLWAVEAGIAPPTLRLYRWDPPAVSLGYFQEWGDSLDERACREEGVDVVRRPTGGRAVFHDDEVTYAVVLPPEHPVGGRSVMEGYRRISEALAAGLRRLGIEARLARPPAGPALRGRDALAGACFDAASRYELEWEGRKVVGSAQLRRASGALLQHGSIPLRFDPERTARLLAPGGRGERFLRLILRERAAGLSDAAGRDVGFDETCAALVAGFAETVGIEWQQGSLSPEEQALARRLEHERYGLDSYNRHRPTGRTTEAHRERTCHAAG